MYLVKTPWWLRAFYPSLVWRKTVQEKVLYLSFDDGPHETATPFVLDVLKQYNARASFFCIGKNVARYPDLYQRILAEGHTVGNHTEHHLNGWKTNDDAYLADVATAAGRINSQLFRPPYGRIKKSQAGKLQRDGQYQVIMWDVLSGDFDETLPPEACLGYVVYHAKPGSIVVFHDSTKAWPRLQYALPKVLAHFAAEGYRFEAL